MSEKVFGYVRVSSRDQNTDRQQIAMTEFGVKEENIFTDKQSGKDFDRPAYRQMMRKMKAGDTLVIKSIDRLGRNYEEILEQWQLLTKKKGVAIVVLDMPLLDTRQGRDLTGTLIANIVLQLLSYVAQTEREFIRQRQAEGIAAARERGVRFGRRPKEQPEGYAEVFQRWNRGLLSARKSAALLGVTHKTFLKWAAATLTGDKSLPSEPKRQAQEGLPEAGKTPPEAEKTEKQPTASKLCQSKAKKPINTEAGTRMRTGPTDRGNREKARGFPSKTVGKRDQQVPPGRKNRSKRAGNGEGGI